MAAVTALRVRDEGGQLLLCPVTDYHTPGTPSYEDNAEGYRLTRHTMKWFAKLRQVSQATIVENKHLGAVLSQIRERQLERSEARSQSAPRRQGQVGHMFKVG